MGRGKKSKKHFNIPKNHPREHIEKRPDLIDGTLPFDTDVQTPGKNKPPFLNYYSTRTLLPKAIIN